jgi:hypothetical protein
MIPPADEHASRKHSDEHETGPPPIQFGLKALLIATTLVALLLAVLTRVGGVWAAALIWVSLLVAGHVLGNVMGTRATARMPSRNRETTELTAQTPEPIDPCRAAAPTTPLGHNAGLGLRIFILVGCGGLVGSLVGTLILWLHNDRKLDLPALGLAAFSSAVVGAFLTFLTTTFFQIVSRAFRHASDHAAKK